MGIMNFTWIAPSHFLGVASAGCSVNYSNRTAGDLNEMMESVTGFMCVKNNNGTRCMDSLPLGCTPLNVSETAQCSNFSAALDSMGCCGGSFISASQSFNETGLAETCLGNTRTAIVGRLQLCNVSHHDPCAVPTPSPTLAPSTRVTTTPRAVATTTSADDDVNGGGGSGTTRLNTGTDVGIALAVVVFVLGVLGGGVLYFHVHKRHLEAEGYTFGDDADEDNAGLLLRDTSDVYASSGAYDG